ncbi:MAG: hypothetical protein QOK15_3447 [Nocardioidaceae bacterium]|nr:hypothetical protein [Nocardioidaceae bacterium]
MAEDGLAEDGAALWDTEADGFDEPADHGLRDPAVRAAWRALLLAHLPAAPARVADLGCGTGTLSLLLAEAGHTVDGLDFSPRMVEKARAKTRTQARVTIALGDASDPPLPVAAYDVVLSRHVLWAMPDPALALARWARLLGPEGTMLLVEGRWSNGAGLAAEETVSLVESAGRRAQLVRLGDPSYWGRAIDDDRYLVRAG